MDKQVQVAAKEFLTVYKEKKSEFFKVLKQGPGQCGSPSLGLSRFDYKRPSAV